MAELGRFSGVKNVSFTPDGGSAINFTDAESVVANLNSETLTDRTAEAIFDQFHLTTRVEISWTLLTKDINTAESLTLNAFGVFKFTRIGRGSLAGLDKIVSADVKIVEKPFGHGAAKDELSEATILFQYISPDGTTAPSVT